MAYYISGTNNMNYHRCHNRNHKGHKRVDKIFKMLTKNCQSRMPYGAKISSRMKAKQKYPDEGKFKKNH